MKFHKKSKKRGVTMIEILVSIFITTLIIGAVTGFFKQILTTSKQKVQFLNDADQARYIISRFTSEIRSAAYGNDGAFPLNQAGDTQIVFYSTLGGNSTTTVKRIRYYVASTTLYKGIVNPTGNPLTYNLASEKVTPLEKNLASSTSNKFRYYDGNFDGSTTTQPFGQPVNVNLVKFVQMNLLLTKQNDKATTTYSIYGGGTIRNLKNNLGN
jgi:Tfp pilus assembly protein PilW